MKPIIKQFSRAQISAAIATAADYLVTTLLYAIACLPETHSTLCGAVCGGALNCTINYYWAFPPTTCAKHHVAAKYLIVWLGSVTLNTYGTVILAQAFVSHGLFSGLQALLYAKISIGILVAVLWNFMLMKHFVFCNLRKHA